MSTNELSLRGAVAEKRKARGWTLRDLSDRSGVSPATINRFENGADATLSNVEAMCAALGIEVGDLSEVRRATLKRVALSKLTDDEAEALGFARHEAAKERSGE